MMNALIRTSKNVAHYVVGSAYVLVHIATYEWRTRAFENEMRDEEDSASPPRSAEDFSMSLERRTYERSRAAHSQAA
jgi:hypothetical protein